MLYEADPAGSVEGWGFELAAELATLDARRGALVELDDRRLRGELRARLGDVRALLGGDVPRTRQILRQLLVGRLVCTTFDEGGRRGYRFTGQGSYAELLPGEAHSTLVVTPAGSAGYGTVPVRLRLRITQ